jgi:hypothetical protein
MVITLSPGTSQVLALMKFVDILSSPTYPPSPPLLHPAQLQPSPSTDGSRLRLMLPRSALGSPRNSAPASLLTRPNGILFVLT